MWAWAVYLIFPIIFSAYIVWVIKTGKIRFRWSVYSRTKQPRRFWAAFTVLIIFTLISFSGFGWALLHFLFPTWIGPVPM